VIFLVKICDFFPSLTGPEVNFLLVVKVKFIEK